MELGWERLVLEGGFGGLNEGRGIGMSGEGRENWGFGDFEIWMLITEIGRIFRHFSLVSMRQSKNKYNSYWFINIKLRRKKNIYNILLKYIFNL